MNCTISMFGIFWQPSNLHRVTAFIEEIGGPQGSIIGLRISNKADLDGQTIDDVTGVCILEHKELEKIPKNLNECFQNIQALEISRCGLKRLIREDLQNLKNLRELKLSQMGISTLLGDLFKGLKHLEIIELQKNKIIFIDEHTFKGLKNLKYVDLSGNSRINAIYASEEFEVEIDLTVERLQNIKELKKLIKTIFYQDDDEKSEEVSSGDEYSSEEDSQRSNDHKLSQIDESKSKKPGMFTKAINYITGSPKQESEQHKITKTQGEVLNSEFNHGSASVIDYRRSSSQRGETKRERSEDFEIVSSSNRPNTQGSSYDYSVTSKGSEDRDKALMQSSGQAGVSAIKSLNGTSVSYSSALKSDDKNMQVVGSKSASAVKHEEVSSFRTHEPSYRGQSNYGATGSLSSVSGTQSEKTVVKSSTLKANNEGSGATEDSNKTRANIRSQSKYASINRTTELQSDSASKQEFSTEKPVHKYSSASEAKNKVSTANKMKEDSKDSYDSSSSSQAVKKSSLGSLNQRATSILLPGSSDQSSKFEIEIRQVKSTGENPTKFKGKKSQTGFRVVINVEVIPTEDDEDL